MRTVNALIPAITLCYHCDDAADTVKTIVLCEYKTPLSTPRDEISISCQCRLTYYNDAFVNFKIASNNSIRKKCMFFNFRNYTLTNLI